LIIIFEKDEFKEKIGSIMDFLNDEFMSVTFFENEKCGFKKCVTVE
jgi:hypothetical protein